MSGRSGRPSAPAAVRRQVPLPVRPHPGSPVESASDVGRTLRLPAFVGVSTLLGVGAHSVVERSLPTPGLLAAAVLAVCACALLLRGRERSFEAIAVVLLLSQGALHAVLALCHGPSGFVAHLDPGRTMLLGHLLAAGVAAWWLRQGEAAVWAAAGWVWPALAALPVVRTTVLAPAPHRWADATVRVLQDQVSTVRAHPRRGPPLRASMLVAAPAVA